jgi:hypothetical protein
MASVTEKLALQGALLDSILFAFDKQTSLTYHDSIDSSEKRKLIGTIKGCIQQWDSQATHLQNSEILDGCRYLIVRTVANHSDGTQDDLNIFHLVPVLSDGGFHLTKLEIEGNRLQTKPLGETIFVYNNHGTLIENVRDFNERNENRDICILMVVQTTMSGFSVILT